MNSNLNRSYVHFIKLNQNNPQIMLEIIQEVIDKMQYHEGFFIELQQLLEGSENPFENVTDETGSYRRLKQKYTNQNKEI